MPATARVKESPSETLPIEESIRRRAYELYVQGGNQSGSELDDWLQAEDEIRRAQDQLVGRRCSACGIACAVFSDAKVCSEERPIGQVCNPHAGRSYSGRS
ncbi:MAG: hypothetical protein DMG58_06495 [Acidobacteria bacterium]|nr:MAG: hypothetical protein DMG58_06495 [Acidobacteriota bacterium]